MKDQAKTKKQLIEELEKLRKETTKLNKEHSFDLSVITYAAEGISVCHNIPEYPYVEFTAWNGRMTEITGYTMEEINKKGWYQTVYPDIEIQVRAEERMERMRYGDDLHAEPWEITRKDGEKRILRITTSSIESQDGIIHTMAILDDITEQKRAAEAILQVRRDWENIFQAIGHPTIILDAQHNIISANKATVKAAGAGSAEELIGRKCYEMFHGAGEPTEGCPLKKMLASARLEESEMEVEAFGGIFLVSCTPVFDEKGDLQKIIHIATDITERKLAEEFLRKEKTFSDTIINSLPGIFYLFDENGHFLRWNRNFEIVSGYSSEEMGNMNPLDFFSGDEKKLVEDSIQEVFVKGESNVEADFISKDGRKTTHYFTGLRFISDNRRYLIGMGIDITERKRDEEKIIMLSSMVEQSTEGMAIADLDGKLIFVNEAWRCMHGYKSAKELLGRNLAISHNQEQLENEVEPFNKKVMELGAYSGEVGHVNRDGKSFITFMVTTILKDKQGKLCAIAGIARDITERKRAELQIRESEKRYRELYEGSRDGYAMVNMEGTIIESNASFKKMLGYTDEELLIKTYEDITPLKWHPIEAKILEEQVMKRGYSDIYEKEYIRKNGTVFPVEIRTYLLKREDGKPKSMWAFISDITERKKAEEALRASEEELHDNYFIQAAINLILSESLENIPLEEFLQKALNMILSIPWIAFEAIGNISLVEDKADTLIMKAQSNIPEPLKELCVRVPFGKCLCGKAALTQKIQFADHIDEIHEICYEGIVPHGHYSVPILSGGRTLGVLNIYLKEGHIRNQKEEEFLNTVANTLSGIIMRRKAEEEKEKLHAQLLQAQKMEAVGQLSGGIAHDFNNILTAIIGYGNLLKMQVEKDSTLSTYMKYILDSAERAANLTQDLLAFSRKQMISPKPINVNEVIKGTEKILLRLIGADIELSTHLSDKDLIVMADSTQMEHVLMNLATNARDAMPEGGNLLISSDFTEIDERFINMYGYGEKGKYALITVSDTGIGMDEQIKAKIFEPFFTTKEVGKGTGLGLAMVYGIVKQHDGFINVYSEPGKGTTFKVYLPLINAVITDTKEIESPISKRGTETILLAEDDAMVRKFMREVIEGAGYTVIEAKDGEDAIDVFIENKDRIRLLLLDVIMPKKNGKEVYETLKESTPHIKALFVSGYSADILHKQGIISERLEVILKPVSSDTLLRKIRDLLDK